MWKLCSRDDDTCRTTESQPRLKGLVAHRVFCLKSVTLRERAANNRPFRQAGGMNRPAPQIDIHVTSSGRFFLHRCLTAVDTSSLLSDPTAQRRSESTRAEFSVNSVLLAAKDACVCTRSKRTGRPMRWFSQTRHRSPLANISPGGHVMSQPPRHAQLIRADPCHPWFKKCDLYRPVHTGRSAKRNDPIREASYLSVLTVKISSCRC